MDGNLNQDIRLRSWVQFLSASSIILVAALALSMIRVRADLTEDKRYTLSQPSREILGNLEDDIYIQVFLDGEMPIPLKRLKRSVTELLDEIRLASGRNIDFEFINPSENDDNQKREAFFAGLIAKGIAPVDLRASDQEGGKTVKRIFPGMIVNYNGIEVPVNFLKNNPSVPYEQNILHSVEGLEYEMVQTIATLTSDTVFRVAFIEGHNEIPEIETADITYHLARFFTIDRGSINATPGILDKYAAIVIAGPESEYSESDKFVIDQYIMNGGKVLWLMDEVSVNSDSLTNGSTVGLYRPLNIEDQLFRYGVRVNPVIIQDMECELIRLKINDNGNQQFISLPWFYNPLLIPAPDHPVTRNINRVRGSFTNYIDTVGFDGKISKTILLTSSGLSRTISPPVVISLREAERIPDEKEFTRQMLPVAVLLEGEFPSAFRNRPITNMAKEPGFRVLNESRNTRMIVVADADIIRNEVRRNGMELSPLQLGQDKYTGEIYGNREFILNSLNWLVDDNGLMELRSRELKMRLLDVSKINSERLKWQLINLAGPFLLVVLAGVVFTVIRRRYYAG